MGHLVSKATGNWTATTSWYNVETGTQGVVTNPGATYSVTTSTVYNSDGYDFTGTTAKNCVGVVMFCYRNNTTGTVRVSVSANSGLSETGYSEINASDLPTTPSWVFFMLTTPLALDGGTDYAVGVKGSSAGNSTFYYDSAAYNYTKAVVWDEEPSGAPAAGAQIWVVGNQTGAGTENAVTITMNETAATDYGAFHIGNNGTLSYATGSAANPYLRTSGMVNVWGDGIFNMGTTGTPIPRDSVAVLELDCSADGTIGIVVNNGGTFNAQGLSRSSGKNVVSCLLNTDEAVAQTTLGVDTDTGWLDNDQIAVASTTQTFSQCELGALNGNAGASSLTVDGFGGAGGGVAYAHSGTAPTQAEVINITRNVKIRAVTSTLVTYLNFKATSTVDIDWAEIYYIGENAAGKHGIEVETTTGSCGIAYSSVHDTEDYVFYLLGSAINNVNFSYNVTWNAPTAAGYGFYFQTATTGTSLTFDHNIFLYSPYVNALGMQFGDMGGTITYNTVIGFRQNGIYFVEANPATFGTISNLTAHSNSGYGFQFGSSVPASGPHTISNLTSWRNASGGIMLQSNAFIYDTVVLFGNGSSNILVFSSLRNTFINLTSNGDSSFSTGSGIMINGSNIATDLFLYNADFSTASGIKVAHSATDIDAGNSQSGGEIYLYNCKFGASTEVGSSSYTLPFSRISSQKHDQSAGSHKTWKREGIIAIDTTANMYRTASPSERLTPSKAAFKLESGSFKVNVNSGQTCTPSVYVRESVVGDGTDYNGNRIRLIQKRNDAIGVTADTVIDTATVTSEGGFEQLTGTTAAVTDDGVVEFVVDCDGTTGWCNLDDFSATVT